jgi:hypothetical protein
MARMLGTARQPFCGKCCGTHTKKATQVIKRRERRAANQQIRQEAR